MQMVNGQPGHLVLRVCLFEFVCCASVVDVDDLEVLASFSLMSFMQVIVYLLETLTEAAAACRQDPQAVQAQTHTEAVQVQHTLKARHRHMDGNQDACYTT